MSAAQPFEQYLDKRSGAVKWPRRFTKPNGKCVRDREPTIIQLTQSGSALALRVLERPIAEPDTYRHRLEQVRQAVAQLQEPISVQSTSPYNGLPDFTR